MLSIYIRQDGFFSKFLSRHLPNRLFPAQPPPPPNKKERELTHNGIRIPRCAHQPAIHLHRRTEHNIYRSIKSGFGTVMVQWNGVQEKVFLRGKHGLTHKCFKRTLRLRLALCASCIMSIMRVILSGASGVGGGEQEVRVGGTCVRGMLAVWCAG